ncbi:FecR domain-containing protein [Hymenobacter sp. M29]|uniref:FecR domain-containing protein n=1 Tax=Hymenobacter mellowenesis TaxID=3063995 RepID=A0ABT9A956_9BACT|nr:FecR domain-containing protein [Hymenobacter sp. M29]MDO7845496.1 FecR domain-containing protein [Hymenobacter sp. M29]
MPTAITQTSFTAYVQGTASATEAEAVRHWLGQPENQPQAQQWMHEHWETLAAANDEISLADEPDYEQMLTRLHVQMLMSETNEPRAEPTVAPMWRRWAAAAAVAGTLLAGGGWLYSHRAAAPQEYATAYGQTSTLQLPDGSSVTLNGHSTLRYPTAWVPGKPREVWLDGEAYFAVQHQADNQRFVVHTLGGFSVEVLGTKFTVVQRRTQGRVVLLSGKVRVSFDDKRQPDVVLAPGDLVDTRETAPAKLEVTARRNVPTAPYASWKDNMLVLDGTTIAELANRLEDTYGLQVIVATPELNERKVTGTVPVQDLDVLLQSLEETFHIRAVRQGNRLTLTEQN